jgi:hypothetical protein
MASPRESSTDGVGAATPTYWPEKLTNSTGVVPVKLTW